jgi:hypothetical protein
MSILPIAARTAEFLKFHQIFNRLVAQFGGSIRNLPGSLMSGCITTKGRIEYRFKSFGTLSVVFVEVKLKIGSDDDDRLDAIAQVIAECDGQALLYSNRTCH